MVCPIVHSVNDNVDNGPFLKISCNSSSSRPAFLLRKRRGQQRTLPYTPTAEKLRGSPSRIYYQGSKEQSNSSTFLRGAVVKIPWTTPSRRISFRLSLKTSKRRKKSVGVCRRVENCSCAVKTVDSAGLLHLRDSLFYSGQVVFLTFDTLPTLFWENRKDYSLHHYDEVCPCPLCSTDES